jgi:hypothetical protein
MCLPDFEDYQCSKYNEETGCYDEYNEKDDLNYIYVIDFLDNTGTVKVGGTINYSQRVKEYKRSHPHIHVYLFEVKDNSELKRPYVPYETKFKKLYKNNLCRNRHELYNMGLNRACSGVVKVMGYKHIPMYIRFFRTFV